LADAERGRRVGALRIAIATGLGTGYSPLVPGTVGSLPGLALAWAARTAAGPYGLLAATLIVAAVGFWAAEGGARHFGGEDPRPVVIDEIAGQMLTLLWIPPTPAALVLGFVVFRVFDVWKPFPAGRLESLPGGSGIMADDLMAGVYANLVVRIALAWLPLA